MPANVIPVNFPYQPPGQAEIYYTSYLFGNGVGGSSFGPVTTPPAPTYNVIYYLPIYFGMPTRITRLLCEVTQLSANSLISLGLYDMASSAPYNLLYATSTLSGDTSGVKEEVLSTPVNCNAGFYFTAFLADDSNYPSSELFVRGVDTFVAGLMKNASHFGSLHTNVPSYAGFKESVAPGTTTLPAIATPALSSFTTFVGLGGSSEAPAVFYRLD